MSGSTSGWFEPSAYEKHSERPVATVATHASLDCHCSVRPARELSMRPQAAPCAALPWAAVRPAATPCATRSGRTPSTVPWKAAARQSKTSAPRRRPTSRRAAQGPRPAPTGASCRWNWMPCAAPPWKSGTRPRSAPWPRRPPGRAAPARRRPGPCSRPGRNPRVAAPPRSPAPPPDRQSWCPQGPPDLDARPSARTRRRAPRLLLGRDPPRQMQLGRPALSPVTDELPTRTTSARRPRSQQSSP
mmetsp:Transcript_83706/g.260062  ORF Transcript_83706/g.260062 Transcript_83706/m.260062 type:complete len:245 (-) Transcript_83706:339-1073(-)